MQNSLDSLSKRFRFATNLDPERDWLVLIMIGTIILFGIIVWNVWAFNMVAEGGIIGRASTVSTTSTFNQTSLDTLRTVFTGRAAEEVKYLTNGYTYVDPSL